MPRRLRGDAELGIGSKSTPWYSCYRRYHHRSGRVIAKFTERSVNRHYPPLENYSEIVRSRERNSIRNSPSLTPSFLTGHTPDKHPRDLRNIVTVHSIKLYNSHPPFLPPKFEKSPLIRISRRNFPSVTLLSSSFQTKQRERAVFGTRRIAARRIEFGAACSCGTGNKQSGG